MKVLFFNILCFSILSINIVAQSNPFVHYVIGHPQKLVTDIQFSPDSELIVTATSNHKIIIWEAASRKRIKQLSTGGGKIKSIRFSPDGKYLACKTKKFTHIWSASNWNKIFSHKIYWKHSPIEFHPTEPVIIGGSKNKIVLHDFLNGTSTEINIAAGIKLERFLRKMQVSPDGTELYTIGLSKKRILKVYDLVSKEFLRTIEIPERYKKQRLPAYINLSPDGKLLLFHRRENSDLILFETQNYQPVLSIASEQEKGNGYFTSSGKHLIASTYNSIRLYDLFRKKLLFQLDDDINLSSWNEGNGYRAIASPNGKYIAAINTDGKIDLWNLTKKTNK